MKKIFHNQKGITTADVIVAVILITIFVAMLTVVSGTLTETNAELERQTDALYYAMKAIEIAKGQDFSKFPKAGTSKIEGIKGLENGYILDGEGNATPYYQNVKIKDFVEMDGNIDKRAELIKKVTVVISYKQENEEKTVELSTVVSREE